MLSIRPDPGRARVVFFDELDVGTGAQLPDDILVKQEAIKFVAAYYHISDPAVRRRLFELTKATANLA